MDSQARSPRTVCARRAGRGRKSRGGGPLLLAIARIAAVCWPIGVLAGCVGPAPLAARRGAERLISPPKREWAFERPGGGASEAEEFWRDRYRMWKAGTLEDYPFTPYGEPDPPFDPTPEGRVGPNGLIATQPPVRLPERSLHETEPWGDPGCVWPVRARWTPMWEDRYSQWIETEVDADFLYNARIAVDCADAPYAFRFIFARMHYLPQGCHNNQGAVFGNWNTRFADLPTAEDWRQDARFRAALDYAMERYVQGRSIPFDTYPILLQPDAGFLRPGTVAADRHHVRIIHRIVTENYRPIRHLSATLPSKVRVLADEALSSSMDNDGIGWGLVNWSWWDYDFRRHRFLCVPDRKMPGFSLSQYDIHDMEIAADAIHRMYQGATLKREAPDRWKLVRDMLEDLETTLRTRAAAVEEGWAYYRDRPENRDPSTREYDNFSTPGRDKRIRRLFVEIQWAASAHGISIKELNDEMRQRQIDIGFGRTMTLKEFHDQLRSLGISSEPWDPPHRRWGLSKPIEEAGTAATMPPAPEENLRESAALPEAPMEPRDAETAEAAAPLDTTHETKPPEPETQQEPDKPSPLPKPAPEEKPPSPPPADETLDPPSAAAPGEAPPARTALKDMLDSYTRRHAIKTPNSSPRSR